MVATGFFTKTGESAFQLVASFIDRRPHNDSPPPTANTASAKVEPDLDPAPSPQRDRDQESTGVASATPDDAGNAGNLDSDALRGPEAGAETAPVSAGLPTGCSVNDTRQCAASLALGSKDADSFRGINDDRFYYFVVKTPGTLRITLDPMPNSRPVTVRVLSEDGSPVHSRRFPKGTPGSFVVAVRSLGKHYITLEPGSCCAGAPYTYALALDR
jgi:hypothetical protein